eukprot:12365369-Heterocapsa_arctica.AAC.1
MANGVHGLPGPEEARNEGKCQNVFGQQPSKKGSGTSKPHYQWQPATQRGPSWDPRPRLVLTGIIRRKAHSPAMKVSAKGLGLSTWIPTARSAWDGTVLRTGNPPTLTAPCTHRT